MFIRHLALRTLTRLGGAVAVVPLVVIAFEFVLGAPDASTGPSLRYVVWSVALFPLAAGWVIADVFVELDATGERIGAESLGISSGAVRAAILVPILMVAIAATFMEAERVPSLQPAQAQVSAGGTARGLRGVSWSSLERVPGGWVERLRRITEPFLALVIGWLAIEMARAFSRRSRPGRPARAVALIGVIAAGLGVYVVWTLSLHVLRAL